MQDPGAAVAPAAPARINVPLVNFNGKYAVSWGNVTGTVTHYELYESTDGKFTTPGTLVYSGPNTSAQFTDKPEGRYYYRVRACNSELCSDYLKGTNGVSVFRLRLAL